MKRIKNEAIDEAIKKAVIPLMADIEVLKIRIEDRDNRILVLEKDISSLHSQTVIYSILTGAGGIGLGLLIGFIVFSSSGG